MYFPGIGRFLSRDPSPRSEGDNLYQYCNGNPVDWVDPYGLALLPPAPSLVSVEHIAKEMQPIIDDWGSRTTSKGDCVRFVCDDPWTGAGGLEKLWILETHGAAFITAKDDETPWTCEKVWDAAHNRSKIRELKEEQEYKCCEKGETKVALAIESGLNEGLKRKPRFMNANTEHWYKQMERGYWVHKRGRTGKVEYLDSEGKPISNPKYAKRNYKGLNYDTFCGFGCVPKNTNVDVSLAAGAQPHRSKGKKK